MASVTTNELCKVCKDLVSEISFNACLETDRHHPTLESLEESSKNACGICIELLRSLKDSFASETDPLKIDFPYFPISCVSDTSSASWQSSFEITFISRKTARRIDFSMRFILEVVEDSESNLVEYTPFSSTDSPQSWDLIGRWLNQCTQDHGRCNAAISESWAPTRLLDIGTSENSLIRLLDRDETLLLSNKPYATLSHCWGKTSLIKTTQHNVLEHQHEIPHHYLPPTFKDAIKIARNLSIRYLWIDSLCIIQDDAHDWEHEADLMSKVYRYSFINIAATGSDSSIGGCFWERDERTVLPTEVYIQWHNSWCDRDEEPPKIKYRVVLDADLWTRKLTDEPLNRRCWVLQERILSPRVLHFGHEQLFWECREFVACETYHRGLPAALQSHPLINIKRLQLGDEPKDNRWPAKYISKAPKDTSYVQSLWDNFTSIFRPIVVHETTLYAALNSASVYQDWYAVVELYSMGNLTFPNDKLVALSGIAQTIVAVESSKLGDGYLAGLWQSSLPASLLWQLEYTESPLKTHHDKAVTVPYRYAGYIAPTWSWASIDGRVSFTTCQVNYKSEDYLATLENASVSYHGNYRFGQITSGFVKLSGPIASALWAPKHQYFFSSKWNTITHIFPPHLNRHASVKVNKAYRADLHEIVFGRDPSFEADIDEILLDTAMEDIPEELTLLCVVGTKESNGHIDMVRGLVLQRSSHSNDYTRIGVFMTRRKRLRSILVNMPRQSVTIV